MAGFSLVLDFDGKAAFDRVRICDCLRDLPGIFNWHEGDYECELFGEFEFAGDRTMIHLFKDDPRFISVEGMGDASLQIALEVQRKYGGDIYAVDLECSFAILLSEVSSLAEFNEKIGSGWGSELIAP